MHGDFNGSFTAASPELSPTKLEYKHHIAKNLLLNYLAKREYSTVQLGGIFILISHNMAYCTQHMTLISFYYGKQEVFLFDRFNFSLEYLD